MIRKGPANPERSFGISVGSVLLVIAAVLVWRGRLGRAEIFAGIGAFLLFFGLVHPAFLKWPSALWWKLARFLGHVNARIWLTVLFAIVLVPVSLLWRLIGKDPLARKQSQWPGWSPYPPRYRDPKHYSQMY